jgi:hypothetical protein
VSSIPPTLAREIVWAFAAADIPGCVEAMRDGVDPVAARVALNEATFRRANEEIEATSASLGIDGRLPFICECADMTCTVMVQLTRQEYEAVRADPTHFLTVPGHARAAKGWAIDVETHGRYAVVAKIGDAAVVAAEHDPRREEEHGRA